MHPTQLTITLTYQREHVQSFYYDHGKGNFWSNPRVSKNLLIVVGLFAAAPLLMRQAQKDQEPIFVVGAVMAVLIGFVFLLYLAGYAWKFYRWKYSVNAFSKKLDGTSETITCTESAFTSTTETETIVTRWEQVHQVTFTDRTLSLHAGKNMHILPAASMKPDQFAELVAFVKSKIT